MTDTENLVLEILRRIQAELADNRERLRLIEMRLGAVDSHLVALQLSIQANTDELRQVQGRIERIERRLEITETPGAS